MPDLPKRAYKTTAPAVVAAFVSAAEAETAAMNHAVAEAEKIGKNKGVMVVDSFGDKRIVGLAPIDPADPPEGWRHVRDQFEPRRGNPGEKAREWLRSVQPPNVRDVMTSNGLPKRCAPGHGFFGVPGIFLYDNALYAIYKGGPSETPSDAWVEIRPSEFYAAQEDFDATEQAKAMAAGLNAAAEAGAR